MVAKVTRQRQATAIATAPASRRSRAAASRSFLAALFADAGFQLFAALVLAGLADLLAARQALAADGLAPGGILRFRAHLLHHALLVLRAVLAFAGGPRVALRAAPLRRALLAGLRVLGLGAHLLHHALAPRGALFALAGLLGLGMRGPHLRRALFAGLGILRLRAVKLALLRIGAAREQHAEKEDGSFHARFRRAVSPSWRRRRPRTCLGPRR